MIEHVFHATENVHVFIKAVSETVFEMVNAIHHDKPSIFIGATFRDKLVSHLGFTPGGSYLGVYM